MKRYFLSILLLLYICALSAQNKSDSTSLVSPANLRAAPIKKGGVIRRSQELLPSGDSPFKVPVRVQQNSAPKPTPEMIDQPFSAGSLVGTGGVAYEEVDPWGFAPSPRYLNRWYREISGFRGFVDQGITIGFGKATNHRYDFYGAFGYQFNPIFLLV